MNLIFAAYILLEIMQYIVFADVILSWLRLFGLNLRPKFLADIIDPIYQSIRNNLPTSIGPLDLTPIVVLMVIFFLIGMINMIFPGTYLEFSEVFKF